MGRALHDITDFTMGDMAACSYALRQTANPLFSPRGEAKCVRGASVGGARRLTNGGVRDSTLSTASKCNEVMAGLSRASTVRR